MKKTILLAILLVSFLLSGCAIMTFWPRPSEGFKSQVVYSVSYDKVWSTIIDLLGEERVGTVLQKKEEGKIITGYFTSVSEGEDVQNKSRWSYNIKVKAIGGGKTEIKIIPKIEAKEKGWGFVAYQWTDITDRPGMQDNIAIPLTEWLYEKIETKLKQIPQSETTETSTIPVETNKTYTKADYINLIALQNIHIGETASGDSALFGEVRNNGSKTLKTIELTINCLDQNGKVIYTTKYHPVWPQSQSLTVNNPLNSGESRKLGFRLSDVPAEWDKKVDVKVTDIEFVE